MSSEDGAPAPFQIDRPSDASQVDNMTPFADSPPTTVAQWAPKGVRASDADLRRVMEPSMQTPKPALLGGDAPSSAARPRRLRRASGAFLANRGGAPHANCGGANACYCSEIPPCAGAIPRRKRNVALFLRAKAPLQPRPRRLLLLFFFVICWF